MQLDRLRNAWVHQPSGVCVSNCAIDDPHDPSGAKAKLVAKMLLERFYPHDEIVAVVYEDKPISFATAPVEVKMTNFGGQSSSLPNT